MLQSVTVNVVACSPRGGGSVVVVGHVAARACRAVLLGREVGDRMSGVDLAANDRITPSRTDSVGLITTVG